MLNRLKAYGISETGLARVKVRGYDDLVVRVCAHHGVTPAQVTQRGVRGTPRVSAARGDLCRRFYADGQSLKEIGRMLQLDHTTVLHACRLLRELIATDGRVREDWDKLLRSLTG